MEPHDYTSLAERISVLETEKKQISLDVRSINDKLDALLTFKSKGLGAIQLMTILLIVGSGIATFIYNVMNSIGVHIK